MDKGLKVLYKDELYTIIHDYNNGVVEIMKVNGINVQLVSKDELTPLEDA